MSALPPVLSGPSPEGPQINNCGPGQQTNYSQSGGQNNQQFIAHSIHNVFQSDNALLRDRLPFADQAAFDASSQDDEATCLAETRMDVLKEMRAWTYGSSRDSCIFWLNGMAGTGKSTIARTIAREVSDKGYLGASFFFSRGKGDLSSLKLFFTSLAWQLSSSVPATESVLAEILREHPDIATKSRKDQWAKLIMQPLATIKSTPKQPVIVFVIDALDECDNDNAITNLIALLGETRNLTDVQVRTIVTSRPETPVRLGFKQVPGIIYRDLLLHDIPRDIVDADICLFFYNELKRIKQTQEWLLEEWPNIDEINELVSRSGGLFIYAATVCRLLEQAYTADHALNILLQDRNGSSLDFGAHANDQEKRNLLALDAMYGTILERAMQVETPASSQVSIAIWEILSIIAIIREEIPVHLLARLTSLCKRDIFVNLRQLHSVVRVPPMDKDYLPIHIFHTSFRDYLLRQQVCIATRPAKPQFAEKGTTFDESSTHQKLAVSCLQLLNGPNGLRKDICSIGAPGIRRAEVQQEKIQSSIPTDVSYACRYWVYHVNKSGLPLVDGDVSHKFLHKHFLHWLEALSWLGQISSAIALVSELQSLVKSKRGPKLTEFLNDAWRFLLRSRQVIDSAPLQVYHSALAFAPRESVIRKLFVCESSALFSLLPSVPLRWSAELQKLEGHYGPVSAVAFSPDGSVVASASDDMTVRLWNVSTGEETQRLEGHIGWLKTVTFSPDGTKVASASHDDTTRLWNAMTGKVLRVIQGCGKTTTALAFSPDSSLLASASSDDTVQIWDTSNGKEAQKLEGYDSVVSSPKGLIVISTSADNTARLMNVSTGQKQTLSGHRDNLIPLAFSMEGILTASVCSIGLVRLYSALIGKERDQVVDKLLGSGPLNTVAAFSPNGTTLASTFRQTIRLWDLSIGKETQTIEGHESDVTAIAFSPDGSTLISASTDQTVRLWQSLRGSDTRKLEGHSETVNWVVFSRDGSTLASASSDHTVRLWNVATGKETRKLEMQHKNLVNFMAFSPDGSVLILAHCELLQIWNVATGKARQKLEGHSWLVEEAVFSPDSLFVASISLDHTARLWNVHTGRETQRFEWDDCIISTVAFSSDGKLIALAGSDKTVRICDVLTGKETKRLEGHSGGVSAVAFSNRGRFLASASYDETIRLWDVSSGKEVRSITAEVFTRSLEFSDGNRTLLTTYGNYHFAVDFDSVPTFSTPTSPIDIRDHWVRLDDQEILWMPFEYRETASAVHKNTLAIGHASGAVSFFRRR